jgi:hypothetical protein
MKRQTRSWAIAALAARFIVAVVAVCTCVTPAHAGLTWGWIFGGTEQGTFETNGTLADAAGSFNFTITDFTVTASTVSSLVGRPYVEYQPLQGFLWDGSTATQFYRSSGSFTNGSNFYVSDPSSNVYSYLFYAPSAQGALRDSDSEIVVNFSALTLLLIPSAVPEIDPAAGGSALSLVAGVLAMIEQRRRRATLVA